ncbi:hypothetical protein [Planctomonas psychrotolerans]|uniref:hypothetical protein n=1 Tax=Planctomonas psychrotolerans TaxID=2528712 RepID=UPI00123B84BF|nr:hypothetical protein [Planctomonas psychrotolerans]
MNPEDRFAGFSALVERLFFVGFSAVAFLALVVVVGLLVRFLLVATKAAEIYVRQNSAAPGARPSSPGASASTAGPSTTVPGAPPTRPYPRSTAGTDSHEGATTSTASPVDPRQS